ncbi:MAG: sugar transporter [Desulfobacteraceae bacterium]|nr:MAG: sugar transporter [Desulfobacteraceae bacterium]
METKRKFVVSSALLAMVVLLSACASYTAMEPVSIAQAPLPKPSAEYVILPGDQLEVKFFYNPELNELVTVRPDGIIAVQLLDNVKAAGKTPSQLDNELTQLYSKELRKPEVTVLVRSFSGHQIFVGGEVDTQGIIEMRSGLTPLQAVVQAGGFLETAQPSEALVIRKGEDNRPVPIRVDLASAMYAGGDASNFELMPNDIVYVPKSAIAKANKFVNQYIEQLLLFRGVSFGFAYDINN